MLHPFRSLTGSVIWLSVICISFAGAATWWSGQQREQALERYAEVVKELQALPAWLQPQVEPWARDEAARVLANDERVDEATAGRALESTTIVSPRTYLSHPDLGGIRGLTTTLLLVDTHDSAWPPPEIDASLELARDIAQRRCGELHLVLEAAAGPYSPHLVTLTIGSTGRALDARMAALIEERLAAPDLLIVLDERFVSPEMPLAMSELMRSLEGDSDS